MSDEQEQKSKPLKWKCPECGNVLTTYVPLSQSPYCSNPEKHPKKSVTMVPK